MFSISSAHSANIPDLGGLTISSRGGAMPVTTRSMKRGDLARSRRDQRVSTRQSVSARQAADEDDEDDDDDDDNDQEDTATQELNRAIQATRIVTLHFAAMVPDAWFRAKSGDASSQSVQLLNTITGLTRYGASNPDFLDELQSISPAATQDRAWMEYMLQLLRNNLASIRAHLELTDVPDTAKALSGWHNALRNIVLPLKLFHTGKARIDFATIIIEAWEFAIASDFDFGRVFPNQPAYTRTDQYGNNLFRTITQGSRHGTFGLTELNWILANLSSTDLAARELAERARRMFGQLHRQAHQPSQEITAAMQEILLTLRRKYAS